MSSSGFGNTRDGNQHGTLQPTSIGRVHVQYKDSGVRVWETPTVARVAIERGQAKEIKHDKSSSGK